MTDLNLLDYFALYSTQVVKLHAQLHHTIAADEVLQAKVELKLTPAELPPQPSGAASYQLGARLICEGYRSAPGEGEPSHVFSIECTLNAGYHQFQGEPIAFQRFSQNHASLTRQLYPLIHHQLRPLFSQLGIPGVRLPQEIVHSRASEVPRQVH